MMLPLKHILIVHNFKDSVKKKKFENMLKQYNIKFSLVARSYVKQALLSNIQLVITLGGDGTFLRTAHLLKHTPLLAVSLDRTKSESFFSQASLYRFNEVIQQLLKGAYTIKKLPRLQAKLNNKIIEPFAINEFFIGNAQPYLTSYYTLQYAQKKEQQKSSGVLIYTSIGSYGWAGTKKTNFFSSKFHYKVREPYTGRIYKPLLKQGTLNAKQSLTLISNSDNNILVADSCKKVYAFKKSSTVRISVSSIPLAYIVLNTKSF